MDFVMVMMNVQDRTKPRALIIDGASLIAASGDKVLRRLVKLVR
jgi:hypothetical protein